MPMINLRVPTPSDTPRLLELAIGSELFTPTGAADLLGYPLEQLHANALAEGHAVSLAESTEGELTGWIYYAPDTNADAVWNVWWIGVSAKNMGNGTAVQLLKRAEAAAQNAGARVMVIETSDNDLLLRARRFYLREGYAECGRIPHFYAEGEAKVIFSKHWPVADGSTSQRSRS